MTLSMSAMNAWCDEYLLLKSAVRPALLMTLVYYCSATTGLNAEPIFHGDPLKVASNAASMLADEKRFTVPLLTMSPVHRMQQALFPSSVIRLALGSLPTSIRLTATCTL